MPSSGDISGRSFLGDLAMNSFRQKELLIRRAHSIADYLFLRTLRNSVRQYMTNHTASIDYIQQLRFYLRRPDNVEIFIACIGARRVGYVLLRCEGKTTLVTEAVVESHRGAGFGARLLHYAQDLRADLTAEIRDDNIASINLHRAAGFKFAGAKPGVQTFRYTRAAGTD